MAYQRCIEARWRGAAGYDSLSQPCEANRLITERCQNFLMPKQALAVRLKHQHRFADAATGRARGTLNGYRLIGRDAWKPDIETRSSSNRALYLHGAVMFADDVTRRREPKTVAVGARRKEWLEDPLQRCLHHAPPRIGKQKHNDGAGDSP